jgi:hypothetical protein
MTVDVDVFLDLREWPRPVRDRDEFVELWSTVEPEVARQPLVDGRAHRIAVGDGRVGVTIARVRAGTQKAGPQTRFRIVNVLEPARARVHCTACSRLGAVTHGAFRCAGCAVEDADAPDNRWCADHVDILDGAMTATCERHRPACADCSRPATFRCGGPRCGGRTAHCDRHRAGHAPHPDVAYCAGCFADGFPECTVGQCRNVGAVACEMTDDAMTPCGVRMCALHLNRWQVFGVERLGLALCRNHGGDLVRLAPEVLLRRIVVGTYRRATGRRDAEPLPSLQAFAHTLRNQRHHDKALDYAWIHRTLMAMRTGSPDRLATMLAGRDTGGDPAADTAGKGRDTAFRQPKRGWQAELRELRRGADAGGQLVERLRALARERFGRDGERLATALRLAEYKEPRVINGEQRPGLLFVRVPPELQQLFRRGRTHFATQLSTMEDRGVVVEIERGDRSARR